MSRTKSIFKNSGPARRKQLVLIAAVSAIAALASGCGPATQLTTNTAGVAGGVVAPPPAAGSNTSNLNGVQPQAMDAIKGNYGGTLYKRDLNGQVVGQPYSMSITSAQYTATGQSYAQTYGYIRLDSNGAIGPVHYEAYLALGLNGLYGLYSLVSAPSTVPTLNDSAISLELIFALGNSGQFDPTQSRFYIKDCGFSQDVAVCSNLASDVWFGNDLGKR